jgi:hypothetical protein
MGHDRLAGKVAIITVAALAVDGGYSASGPTLGLPRKVKP